VVPCGSKRILNERQLVDYREHRRELFSHGA
jgi:hypothetical protein